MTGRSSFGLGSREIDLVACSWALVVKDLVCPGNESGHFLMLNKQLLKLSQKQEQIFVFEKITT